MEPADPRIATAIETILDALGEDDFALWEVVGAVREALPDLDDATAVELTREAAIRLLDQGEVELLEGRALHQEGRPVPRGERAERLSDHDAWCWDQPWEREYLTLTLAAP